MTGSPNRSIPGIPFDTLAAATHADECLTFARGGAIVAPSSQRQYQAGNLAPTSTNRDGLTASEIPSRNVGALRWEYDERDP